MSWTEVRRQPSIRPGLGLRAGLSLAVLSSVVPACKHPPNDGARARTDQPPAAAVDPSSGHGPSDTLRAARRVGGPTSWGIVTQLAVVGSYLLVYDQLGELKLSVVDRRTGSIVRRFGRGGAGPGEFRDANGLLLESHLPPRVWVLDRALGRLSLLDLDALDPVASIRPFHMEGNPDVVIWRGGGAVVVGSFFDHPVVFADSGGERSGAGIGGFPVVPRVHPDWAGWQPINRAIVAVAPDRSHIALVYLEQPRLDIYDLSDSTVRSAAVPHRFRPPAFVLEGRRPTREEWFEREWTFKGATATMRFIYALYCGCAPNLNGNADASRLEVYTWDGKLAAQVVLVPPATGLAVTPDDSVLYAGLDEPYPTIAVWELPPWLRNQRNVVQSSMR
jgi:hypothetical protein